MKERWDCFVCLLRTCFLAAWKARLSGSWAYIRDTCSWSKASEASSPSSSVCRTAGASVCWCEATEMHAVLYRQQSRGQPALGFCFSTLSSWTHPPFLVKG